MTTAPRPISSEVPSGAGATAGGKSLWWALVRLARPHQWSKGVFVFIGPLYGGKLGELGPTLSALGAFLAFGFASSACYVINDLKDREADRAHPRKRNRPIAAGLVSPGAALTFAAALWGLAGASLAVVFLSFLAGGERAGLATSLVALATVVYIVNVLAYSLRLKHVAILDVISLALGFVLRVLAGCAAVVVAPSSWLLNVTFFIAMFLAFGKRLGERRTLGESVADARRVQASYTDDLLRMVVVVTGVATLLTYAGYVQSQGAIYEWGFNLLWLTMLPATYGLLRCIVLLESGRFDDPTELAVKDRPFQLAGLIFVAFTVALHAWAHQGRHPG